MDDTLPAMPVIVELNGDALASLLLKAALSPAVSVERLPGGRNNRVFRVVTPERLALLKAYFQSPDDSRDRMHHEYGFCTFARRHGVDCVAEPLACDPDQRWALYEFIEGEKLALSEVTAGHVREGWEFVLSLNARRASGAAQCLPAASEACFSLQQHLDGVRSRVDRLASMDQILPVDREACLFVQDSILPLFEKATKKLLTSRMSLDQELAPDERCLSPSDFGFHNALVRPSGSLCFLDFEFAGWDDPAKLIIDFANQPDILLPDALSTLFRNAILDRGGFGDALPERVRLLEPLYQIKWACICLNDFLPFGRQRRAFTGDHHARNPDAEVDRKNSQLERARRMAQRAAA